MSEYKFFLPEDFKDILEMPLGDACQEICERAHEILEKCGVFKFLDDHVDKSVDNVDKVVVTEDKKETIMRSMNNFLIKHYNKK